MAKYRIVKLKNYDDYYVLEQKFFCFWVAVTNVMELKKVKENFDRLVRNPRNIVIETGTA